MKITEIKPRRKFLSALVFDTFINPQDYGAEADSVGLLVIDTELLELERIKAGVELSDSELTELVMRSHIKRAKSRAMWYLSRSGCSKKTLVDKLSRAFPKEAAIAAANRMEELGYINDEEYAKNRLVRIMEEKKVSLKLAQRLLLAEGVDREFVEAAAEEVQYEPTETILSLIERKYKNKLSDEKGVKNTIAALIRKGYSYSEVRNALKEYEILEETEEF